MYSLCAIFIEIKCTVSIIERLIMYNVTIVKCMVCFVERFIV